MTNTRKSFPLPDYWIFTGTYVLAPLRVTSAELAEGLALLTPLLGTVGDLSITTSFEDGEDIGSMTVSYHGDAEVAERVLAELDELYQRINNDEI